MAVRNGLIADSEDIWKVQGTQFKNLMQSTYNQALIGWNSKLNGNGIPNLKDIKYDVFNSDTATTKTGWQYSLSMNEYLPTSVNQSASDTLHNPDGVTNPTNFFDEDPETYATKTYPTNGTCSLGTTFSSKFVGVVKIKCRFSSSGGPGGTFRADLETYDGSNWNFEEVLIERNVTGNFNSLYDEIYNLSKTVQGIRVRMYRSRIDGSGTLASDFYILSYGPAPTTNSLIFQTSSLPTIKDCIPTWNAQIDPANTLTVSISADGTNYETVEDSKIHRFTNTGDKLYVKFEIDRQNTEAVDTISEYAVWINPGGV